MQKYKHDELVATQTGESLGELIRKMRTDSTSANIGELPSRGELVRINGLLFVVLSKSDKQGTLHLELVKPKNNTD